MAITTMFVLVASAHAQTVPQLYEQMNEASEQKNYAKLVEVCKVYFAKKKNILSWDYLRGAQAAAQAGQVDLAFVWLDKMLESGWRNAEMLEKDESFKSIRRDMRWTGVLERTRAALEAARVSLDPERAGVSASLSLAIIDGAMADPKIDAKALYTKLTQWSGFSQPQKTSRWLRFENSISDTLIAPYFVYIPSHYDATKPTGMLVYLRGGIGSPEFPSENDPDYLVENPLLSYCEENNLIEIFPQGSSKVFWTHSVGMQNIQDQIKSVRQKFYVDDDRVFLTGFSNGGSGVYAFALNNPSPFAALYSINGQLSETICLSNLTNRPLFTLASEKDDYSDVGKIRNLNTLAVKLNAPWRVTELPGQGHYYRPYEDEAFPAFFANLATVRRDQLPKAIRWETADVAVGRCDWLQIDALDPAAPRAFWHPVPVQESYLVERNGRKETRSLADESGMVQAVLENNQITLKTSRVARVTLYFHPEQVDFNRPIEIIANGKRLWSGTVALDKNTIATTFRESFDRRRIYGAKRTFTLPPVRINEKLRQELLTMMARDQAMMKDTKLNPLGPRRDERIKATYRDHTKRLHAMLNQNGWLGAHLVGQDGSYAFWLMVQHADQDPSFQREVLKIMEIAVSQGEASKVNFAYLTDRVRINAGQKQLYGTQLVWDSPDNPQPKPTEDPENLNKRRAMMGMGPIENYLKSTLESMQEIRKQMATPIKK
jgi:predicted esterase